MPGGGGSGDCGGSATALFEDDGRGGDESDFGTSELGCCVSTRHIHQLRNLRNEREQKRALPLMLSWLVRLE